MMAMGPPKKKRKRKADLKKIKATPSSWSDYFFS
jgi:hypothetical protein